MLWSLGTLSSPRSAVVKQSPTTFIISMYSSYRDEDGTPLTYRVNMGHFSVKPGILQNHMKRLTALQHITCILPKDGPSWQGTAKGILPKDGPSWQGTAKRWDILTALGYITTHNMYPAERWDILTGYCRNMRHLDSTCIHNNTCILLKDECVCLQT